MIRFDMKLTAKDIFMFSMHHSYRAGFGLFNILFTIASIYTLITRWPVMLISQKLLMILCAMMFTVIQPGMLYLKATKQVKQPVFMQGMTIEMDDDKIMLQQGSEHGEMTWTDIYKTRIKKDMVILYMSAIRAYLIPSRYWGDDKDRLMELIKSKTRVALW